jgi:small subunit ribosomal protein S18
MAMRRNNKQEAIVRQKHCAFCIHGTKAIDYKDTDIYRRYLSSYGKIVPRRKSGVCMKHQRMLASAVKLARIMALIPFVVR